MTTHEKNKINVVGEWWDELLVWDEARQDYVVVESTPVQKNVKMDSVAVLFAALVANDPGYGGILYHAQGRGDAGWGPVPPAVNTADTTLFDEIDRKAPTSIVYLDPFDVVSLTPTNVLKVRTVYTEAELAGETLREQALFGGDATAAIDSGIIINCIRSDGVFKSGAQALARNIKLTYS